MSTASKLTTRVSLVIPKESIVNILKKVDYILDQNRPTVEITKTLDIMEELIKRELHTAFELGVLSVKKD